MADITPAAWAVLQAIRDLSDDKDVVSVDASAVRQAAATVLGENAAARAFQVPGGTYAGIEAQVWELEDAGCVTVDVGMASPTATGRSADVVDEDYGIRITDVGRQALDGHAV